VANALFLGWLGSRPAEGGGLLTLLFGGEFSGNYVGYAQLSTLYYFAFFIVIMPVLGLIETPRRLPNSITEAVLEKNKGGAGHPAGATAAPETKG
jgi:ubiquinol-cytochrome c reductase cytochrome b subunit